MTTWDVILTEEVERWYFTLDANSTAAVTGAIDLLELEGPTLGRPTVDKVNGSRFHSMKELRPAGTSIRILFIFDPLRQAVLLLGGDTKPGTGNAGTTRTFLSLNDATRNGWRLRREVDEHGTQLA